MVALGQRVQGAGRIYFAGGATAVLHGWRAMTIDIDLKADPEPPGLFEALAVVKDELDINVKLASPEQFIPVIPGWRERSPFIARHGPVEFFHYDPYGQALSKLQRRHGRDIVDVRALLRLGLIDKDRLREMFALIEPNLIRYPAIDPASFRNAVMEFCDEGNDIAERLPGAELVREGLADLEAGRCTAAACLVRIGYSRLKRAGLIPHPVSSSLRAVGSTEPDAELQLYRLLRQQGGDAYSRYNALVRELVSFEQALDRASAT